MPMVLSQLIYPHHIGGRNHQAGHGTDQAIQYIVVLHSSTRKTSYTSESTYRVISPEDMM
jgi:hypothetical protein